MSSYFFNGDVPKYHHHHKCMPYIRENPYINTSKISNTYAHTYKRDLLMNELYHWKDKPYGFQFHYEDKSNDMDTHTNKDTHIDNDPLTNHDIYKMLMDEIMTILEKHNKSITNFDQLEEDVMYYLYHILV